MLACCFKSPDGELIPLTEEEQSHVKCLGLAGLGLCLCTLGLSWAPFCLFRSRKIDECPRGTPPVILAPISPLMLTIPLMSEQDRQHQPSPPISGTEVDCAPSTDTTASVRSRRPSMREAGAPRINTTSAASVETMDSRMDMQEMSEIVALSALSDGAMNSGDMSLLKGRANESLVLAQQAGGASPQRPTVVEVDDL